MTIQTKTYTKEAITQMLTSSNKALERAVVAIYERQTYDEQVSEQTTHLNGVGFNGVDAGYLSYIARWIIERKETHKAGFILNQKHQDKTRRKMMKYAGQLTKIANGEI